jgi:hypothetical protein
MTGEQTGLVNQGRAAGVAPERSQGCRGPTEVRAGLADDVNEGELDETINGSAAVVELDDGERVHTSHREN